jgi:hypothetical protein
MNEILFAELLKHLEVRDCRSCLERLTQFKREGGSQKDAYSVLERLRSHAGVNEDDVLDLMDLVSGWCNPSLRIWKEELEG